MTCLYCGSRSSYDKPVNVCICGRSGSWNEGYDVKLIDCDPQFDTPDALRTARRLWFQMYPVNKPIIEEALARASSHEPR
jgi:hypothetical protein